MKIYKKYLFSHFLKHLLLILFSITTVIWITRVINYLRYITEYSLSLKNFIILISLLIPNMLIITTPIAIVITTIFVLNKLMKNNEIIILQNLGVKKKNILGLLFILNILTSIFLFFITFFLLSIVNLKFEKMKVLMKNDITNLILENNNFDTVKNLTFFAEKDEETKNKLHKFIFYIKPTKNDEKEKIIYAKEADIYGNIIVLKNGNIQEYTKKEKEKMNLIFFEKYSIDLRDFYTIDLSINNSDAGVMNVYQLLKFFKENKTNAIIGELAERIFIPLIGFLISILAGILVLNIKFSRTSNTKELTKIYCFSMGLLGILLYAIKSCKYGIKYVSGLSIVMFLIVFLIIILFNKKEYV